MASKPKRRAGYRWPRTGEKRQLRQPLKVGRLPLEERERIKQLRAEGKAWATIAELTGQSEGALRRWYDREVEQAEKEVRLQASSVQQLINTLAAQGFENVPEATLNALASDAFQLVRIRAKPEERQKALSNLLFLTSKLVQAKASAKRADLEAERLEVERQKLKNVASKARGLEKDLGKKKLSEKELRQKLREIYGLAEEK